MARSKKDVSVLVSAFGVLTSIITALISAVRKRGGTDEDIYRLATPEGENLLAKIAELIVQAGKPAEKPAENCYRVVVDYEQTLQQMIANGKYDYTNSDINQTNFPIPAPLAGGFIKLVHFGRDMESDEVLKELEARGLRAAILPELLAFGAAYNEMQREFPVIALGSVAKINGNPYVTFLDRWGARCGLGLLWYDRGWSAHCRFAAVRKSA